MAANPLETQPIAAQALPVGPAPSSPWPHRAPHVESPWDAFRRFHGLLEAQIVAGRLEADGVPTVLLSALGVGDGFVEIRVPRSLMHRAHWVSSWPPLSDEELLFLATGELPQDATS